MNHKNVLPKYRFPEFDGDWELTSLGSLADKVTIRNRNNLISRTLTNSAAEGIVDQSDYFERDIVSKGNQENYFIVSKGDYVYNPRVSTLAPVGPISKNKLGEGIMSPLYSVFRFKNPNNDFYEHYFKSNFWHSYLKNISNTGARHDRISILSDGFMGMPVPQNSEMEQQKIADCLNSFDELIAAEDKKLALLKIHKKGLMQKLFLAEGKTIPEWRFSEFRNGGDWMKVTLDSVVNYENGKAHENEIADKGKYVVANSKFISTEGEVKKYSDSANLLAHEGDILMVLSDVPNGRAIAKCFLVDKNNTYTVNQRICKLTPKDVAGLLLFYIINRNSYFLKHDDGIKQTNLRKDDVLAFPFAIPKDINEQQRIADCLYSLDGKIVAQAEKIETLKHHKKGLMQGLFPSAQEVFE